jgi:hypothetical protein
VPSRLQKWQTKQIFEAIQEVELDPREFHLENDDAKVIIKHKWSASHFSIGGGPGYYGGRYVVGDAPTWPFEAYSWQSLVTRFSRWLEDVKRDLEMPDLWAELQRDSQMLFGADSDDVTENKPFTQAEQNEIAERLQALAEHVRHTYSLSVARGFPASPDGSNRHGRTQHTRPGRNHPSANRTPALRIAAPCPASGHVPVLF